MAEARLTAVVDTKGAQKADRELKSIAKTSKVVDINVKRTEKSFKSFGTNAAKAVAAIDGPLGGISSRITAVTSLASGGAVAFAGLAVAVTGVGFALTNGVKTLDEMNVSLAKSAALIKATGGAAGFTAEQLQEQAQALALVTLASTDGIQKAQGILQTFDKVSSDTFTRAIGLAQDLATVYGGEAATQATLLGKALQDPVKGVSALNRVGVTFSATQKEQIRLFEEGGETAKAQAVILDNLASQVGGAGSAVASGTLAGALDTTGQRYDEFVAKLADSTGTYETLISLVNTFNKGLAGLTNDIGQTDNNRVQELVAQKQELQAELKGFGEIGELPVFGSLFGPSQAEAKVIKDQIAAINAEIGKIQDANVAKQKAENDALIQGEARQKEIRDAAVAAAKEDAEKKAAAELRIKKDAAQVQLDLIGGLNDSEIEKINTKEKARIDLIKSYRDQELITELEFSNSKAEIEKKAQDDRDAARQAMLDKELEAFDQLFQASTQLSDSLIDAFAAGDNIGDALISTIGDISKSILKAGVDQLIQEQLISKVTGGLLLAEKTAEVSSTVAQAGLNAFASTAAIPVVGPAAAPGAAEAAVAGATSLGAGVLAPLTAREQGGQISAGQNVLVGERGPEIITSESNARVLNANQTRGAMNGGGSVSLVVIDQSDGSKEYSQEQDDDGRIVLLIRNTFTNDFSNPNSDISKSVSNFTTAERRR